MNSLVNNSCLVQQKLFLLVQFVNVMFLRMQILPNDAKARRLFVTSGGLKKVQDIQAEPGTTLSEYITIINCYFPEEIIRSLSISISSLFNVKIEKYSYKTSLSNIPLPFPSLSKLL